MCAPIFENNNKLKRTYLIFFFSLLFSPLLAGQESPLTLKIGVIKAFPPQYSTSEDGQAQGFAIDTIESIAKEADFSIEYIVKETWSDLYNALESGEIDLIPNIGITERRKVLFSFSNPVETFSVHIYTRISSKELSGIEGLNNIKVAVVKKNIGEVLVQDANEAEVLVFEEFENALFALLSGNVDALISPDPLMISLVRQIHVEDQIKRNGPVLTEIKRGISVLKGEEWILDRINPVISKYFLSKEYQNIYIKWYGEPTPFWNINRVIIFMSIIMMILIFSILVWKNYSTKALVIKRTKELSFQNQLIKHVNEGIVSIDLHGSITSWNPGAEKLFGYNKNEIFGKQIQSLFSKDSKVNFYDSIQEKYSIEKLNNDLEIQFIKNDNSSFIGSAYISELKDENENIGYIFIIKNITNRKKAEENLRSIEKKNQALLDTSPACHKILDLDYNLKYMSKSGFKMLKLNKDADIYGKPYPFPFLTDSYCTEMTTALDKVKATGETLHFEAFTSDEEGEEIWLDSILMPIFYDTNENEIEYIVVVSNDITERRKTELNLRHMERMDAVGHLAGGVAHDFNNQLTGILGYAELLLMGLTDPKLKSYAENICSATKRSSDLTKNLLSFSRKGKYRSEHVNINKIINETTELLLRSINKKITIQQDLNVQNANIECDSSQLQNAFLNLGINASDAMPNGGTLTFSTEIINIGNHTNDTLLQNLEKGAYLKISVKDTGEGIPDDIRDHVYEPFFTTKDPGKGTGMGLSSVYGTINQHKGIMFFDSELNKGTTFYIYLPFDREMLIDENVTEESTYKKESLTILVVDDEPSIRDLLTEMLSLSGHSVIDCRNGREAVDLYKYKWKDIDLVIIDMIMPEMDGKDSFLAMKKINPEIKAILSTGYSHTDDAKSLLSEGVLEIINKPFKHSVLLNVLDRVFINNANNEE